MRSTNDLFDAGWRISNLHVFPVLKILEVHKQEIDGKHFSLKEKKNAMYVTMYICTNQGPLLLDNLLGVKMMSMLKIKNFPNPL